MLLHYLVPCEIQTLENDTECAEITVKSNHVKVSHTFKQLLILLQNLLKFLPLTCIQAHRWVCHSLIAGRVLYLSEGQRSNTRNPQHCLVSGAGNTRVYKTRSNSPDINPVDYTICGIAQYHVYQFFVFIC